MPWYVYISVSILVLEYIHVCFHVSGCLLVISELHCCVFVRISPQMSGGIDISISGCGVMWSGVLGALTCLLVIYEL